MIREFMMPSMGKQMTHYESFWEYTPKEYVRKHRVIVCKPIKKLSDEFVSTVLNKLVCQAPKVVAIDLGISLSKIYYVRRCYGNV